MSNSHTIDFENIKKDYFQLVSNRNNIEHIAYAIECDNITYDFDPSLVMTSKKDIQDYISKGVKTFFIEVSFIISASCKDTDSLAIKHNLITISDEIFDYNMRSLIYQKHYSLESLLTQL